MIQVNDKNNTLVITLIDSEPMERKQYLIQAIAAAMRWHAIAQSSSGTATRDWEHCYTLAQLQEELASLDRE